MKQVQHSEKQLLGSTEKKNLVVRATWGPGFVRPLITRLGYPSAT